MAPTNQLPTRNRAYAWMAANPTPAPAKLAAFLDHEPRVLPAPQPALNPKLARLMGCLLLAVLLTIVAVAAALFFFGERPEQVCRLPLTAPQRAQAFRI